MSSIVVHCLSKQSCVKHLTRPWSIEVIKKSWDFKKNLVFCTQREQFQKEKNWDLVLPKWLGTVLVGNSRREKLESGLEGVVQRNLVDFQDETHDQAISFSPFSHVNVHHLRVSNFGTDFLGVLVQFLRCRSFGTSSLTRDEPESSRLKPSNNTTFN